MPTDSPIDETLRLARDLCLGVGAFFVTPAGTVFSNLSDVMRPDDAEQRVAALARSSLTHPAAAGSALFWSAEVAEESGGAQADRSLACVVAPVRDGGTWHGLLGVVDVWLPELDDEQRSGLLALARGLATSPAPSAAPGGQVEPGPSTEPGPGTEPGPSTEPDVAVHEAPSTAPAREVAGPSEPPGSPRDEVVGEPFLGEILDNLPDGLVVTRADGTIVLVNRTFADMTGFGPDAVLGEDVAAILQAVRSEGAGGTAGPGDEWDRLPLALDEVLGVAEPGTALRVSPPGSEALSMAAAGRRIDSRFAGECFVTLVRPAEGGAAPSVQQLGLQDLLDHVEDGIVCCDAEGNVVLVNRAARRLQGLADDQLVVGEPFPVVTGLVSADGQPVTSDQHPLLRSMREDRAFLTQAHLEEQDRTVHVAISARPLRVDGANGAIAVLRDVTVEQEQQAHLTHYALHDPLTGVANRYLLIDALGRMLDGLARRGGFVSLIYLDLDRFKSINDEYGHDTGDEVLRAVAQRLERAVRGEDVVARIGGDEFVVAHVTADRLSDGDAVVGRLRKVLTAPYRFGGLVLDVGASVGWVSASSGGDTPESLIARADRAMYEHKNRRRTEAGEVAR